jgi:hypothetical protein
MLRFLLLLALIVALASCHNCVCAPSSGLRLGMITFDSTEVDTIITRKFRKGSNFSQLIDSVQWDRSKVDFRKQTDTFEMASWSGDILLHSQYDYQVFIPANNKTFNVTEINEPQRMDECRGKVMCVNRIVSVTLNTTGTAIQNDILYLKK